MATLWSLADLLSEVLFRRFSDEKTMARIDEHAQEAAPERGVVSTCQDRPPRGFEVRLPVDGAYGQKLPTSRNLRAGTST